MNNKTAFSRITLRRLAEDPEKANIDNTTNENIFEIQTQNPLSGDSSRQAGVQVIDMNS